MTLTAPKLLYALSGLLLLIFIGAASGFYFAQGKLHTYAESITQLNANAEASDKDIETLKQLELKLENSKETIESAKAIVSESKSYEYQDQIISDIISIAKESGVTVTAIDFPASSGQGGTAGSTSPAPAATAPPAATTPPATPGGIPGGPMAPTAAAVKSVVTNVTIKNPVKYETLLKFIQAIEANKMKMQIAKVAISADKEGGVTSQSFAIEVYTR